MEERVRLKRLEANMNVRIDRDEKHQYGFLDEYDK